MDNSIAVLDLGTNTFKLVISKTQCPFPPVYRSEKVVFIGKGGLQNKRILEDAVHRAQKVLRSFTKVIVQYQPNKIKAVATEAIRNAENSDEILSELQLNIPFSIEEISGKGEAELTWLGVRESGLLKTETDMIIDIGGGSTEVIFANQNKLFWSKSYKAGVSRALEQVDVQNLPSKDTLSTMLAYFKTHMPGLTEMLKQYQPQRLIGTAGSFNSWRKISEPENKGNIPFYLFSNGSLLDLINKINTSPLEQRQNIISFRRETIVPAGIIIKYLMEIHTFKTIYQCSYSLAEGLISKLINK